MHRGHHGERYTALSPTRVLWLSGVFRRLVAPIEQPLASWMTTMIQRMGLRKNGLDSGYKVGARMNAREGDGDGDSPPIDKESEDDDRNR